MSIEEELKISKGDIAHKIVKTALGSVPVVGNGLSELFTTIIAEPSSKRRDKILMQIDTKINELVLKVNNFDINSLATNEVFLSMVSQAYQIAMRTHQEEKIEALLNTITNSAIGNTEENLQHMFIMFIDSFTEWHLRILFLMDNPVKSLQDKGLQTDFMMGSISQIFIHVYPELKGKEEFYKQIVKDLYNRGLINTRDDSINGMMTGSGMVTSRTTDMGKQFINFIVEH